MSFNYLKSISAANEVQVSTAMTCVRSYTLNLEEKMNVIHFEEQSSDEKENALAE